MVSAVPKHVVIEMVEMGRSNYTGYGKWRTAGVTTLRVNRARLGI